ncbi:MAG: response regulator transcription factor [Dehalococcoidia bacterium]|nr:MAG: response regulator transcription factor [Dehalococcoidia bacterium]
MELKDIETPEYRIWDRTMRILVVDDDPEIVSFVKRGLIYDGYDVDTAGDGSEALAKALEVEPDLVILDIMMQGIDGIEVSRRLRQAGDVPILMLTAKGTVADKVAGLDSGADDYLVKPFSFDELLARVRALLRRRQPREGEILRFSDLSLNTATREVRRGNEIIDLTVQEFDLLEYFIRHPRQVLGRDRIYEKVWGYDFGGESNVIEVYVSYLRSKLEAGDMPRLVHTVRGVGYVLKE